jgi:hypothetical protein
MLLRVWDDRVDCGTAVEGAAAQLHGEAGSARLRAGAEAPRTFIIRRAARRPHLFARRCSRRAHRKPRATRLRHAGLGAAAYREIR